MSQPNYKMNESGRSVEDGLFGLFHTCSLVHAVQTPERVRGPSTIVPQYPVGNAVVVRAVNTYSINGINRGRSKSQ